MNEHAIPSESPGRTPEPFSRRLTSARPWLVAFVAVLAPVAMSLIGFWPAMATGCAAVAGLGWETARRRAAEGQTLAAVLAAVETLDPASLDELPPGSMADLIEQWNRIWPTHCESIRQTHAVARDVGELSTRLQSTFGSIEESTSNQEEAVEETASLVANMRQTMLTIGERVDTLLQSSNESATAALQISHSIDDVATNTATLHEVVEASTSSVHEMGASIRQVAQGAEQVQALAESTASSVIQMDRSMQEVSSNAREASALTEQAHAGARAGADAVRATIGDIETISSLTNEAKGQLGGLVARVSKIGSILAAIDEINDETKLLSLNAAIIAAQAGEQGKAFLIVANHVKTLSQRTAASTRDIEELIADIETESSKTVHAMEAGIEAVAQGMNRSKDAGDALETIQEACRDASERVAEIARATAEQSRCSEGVADATQTTSTQVSQMSQAMTEQRRASESMLRNAERALEACLEVHRTTDEQRQTSRDITAAISAIAEMVASIGQQTTVHTRASESVSEAVMHLLENARLSSSGIEPARKWVAQLADRAQASLQSSDSTSTSTSDIATASPASCGSESPNEAGTMDNLSA